MNLFLSYVFKNVWKYLKNVQMDYIFQFNIEIRSYLI